MSQKLDRVLYFFSLYILIPIALVKLFWSGVGFFLDKEPLSSLKGEEFIYHYKIDLAKNILTTKERVAPPKEEIKTYNRIDDIKLKGTYASTSGDGFIVIEDSLGTTFLYKNEKYVGYKLIEIYATRAVLERDGLKYDIVLESDEGSQRDLGSSLSSESHNIKEEAVEFTSNGLTKITREELNSYIKNPNKIWKNIRIQELRKDGNLQGFRVNYVKKGSFFQKAGLKSGDVIKSIDGKELKSLADVMKYYHDIESLDALTLSILRGEEEFELEFNVN